MKKIKASVDDDCRHHHKQEEVQEETLSSLIGLVDDTIRNSAPRFLLGVIKVWFSHEK